MVLGDLDSMTSGAVQHEGHIPHILHHISVGLPEDVSSSSEAEAREASQARMDSCRHHHRCEVVLQLARVFRRPDLWHGISSASGLSSVLLGCSAFLQTRKHRKRGLNLPCLPKRPPRT